MKRTTASIGMALAVSFGVAPVATVLTAGTASAAETKIDKYVGTTTANLNVRTGPGTQYAKAGLIPAGTKITGYVPATGWIKIVSGPYAGKYVSRSYVKVSSVTKVTWAQLNDSNPLPSAPPPVAATTSRYVPQTTNVRSGPSTSTSRVGTLSTGTTVTGTMVDTTWLKIATPSQFAGKYVSTAVLSVGKPVVTTPAPQPSNGTKTGYVMADAIAPGAYMNIRSAPSTTASIVGRATSHSKVVGTPVGDGTWWKVSNGYINSAGLTANPNPSSINARIPLDQLCLIPKAYYSHNGTKIGYGYTESTPRYIQCKALPSLNALEAAYKQNFGKYAEIDNGYRTWAEQSYWYNLYAPLGVTVSPPGKSNHGYGLAIDFRANYGDGFTDFKKGGKGYNWLIANQTRFGFDNPYHTLKIKDDIHWNFVG